MRSLDENVQALKAAVFTDAQEEASKILADAEAKAEAARRQVKEQTQAECNEMLGRASREAEQLCDQAIAAAKLEAQTAELEQREQLLDSVFDAARQRLPEIQERDNYDEIVRQLLLEAVEHLGAETVLVQADKRTRKVLTDQALASISKEMDRQIKYDGALNQGAGLIVRTEDGHRLYDNTLDTRLSRLQSSLRVPVFHLLMGEKS